jgi:hypothetical protein
MRRWDEARGIEDRGTTYHIVTFLLDKQGKVRL